ncbi:type II 3-dehydroquinate dehydratase, partial [Streptococcus pneumoniae]|uniref:type II 3-dehydroquinate dehydratase n=1 Tax=Streptococcus pneumoniae TaxID=1313 RepID=UPI001E535BBA
MDIRKVKKLIELLEESGIDELEIHEGEESVRISRHSKQVAMQREPFRHHSYFSDVAVGVICGLGASGYRLALEAA